MTAALLLLQRYWRPVAIIVMVLATVLAVYGKGRNDERGAWKARMEQTKAAAAKETLRLVEKNYVIAIAAAEVIERERTVTRNLIKKVNVYVPVDSCPLPGGFRVLHDSAARGEDPAAAGRTDAAAVAAQDAASIVIENYGLCREDQQRLISLQQWAREIAATPILCQ